MEPQPDTENVIYLDEFRRAKWHVQLQQARALGQVLLFNQTRPEPALVLTFPTSYEGTPDGAA